VTVYVAGFVARPGEVEKFEMFAGPVSELDEILTYWSPSDSRQPARILRYVGQDVRGTVLYRYDYNKREWTAYKKRYKR
jgi:hypothetical protein